jgi:hypothetical protein
MFTPFSFSSSLLLEETLRNLRAETVRRHKDGLIPVDNNGKSIDEVFGSENEERKMQSVENWIKFVKRPLPKCSISSPVANTQVSPLHPNMDGPIV